MEMQRRERFERAFEAEIEIFEILAHDHVVDAVGICQRAA